MDGSMDGSMDGGREGEGGDASEGEAASNYEHERASERS